MSRLALVDHRSPEFDDSILCYAEERAKEIRRELWTPDRVRDAVIESFSVEDAKRLMSADMMLIPALLKKAQADNKAAADIQLAAELSKL